MGSNAKSIAIVRESDDRVVTFVRLDVPDNWGPPEGCTAVPDDELPAGWQHAPDNSPVPPSISARQIRLWLVRHGVSLAMVEAAIDGIPDAVTRESVRVEWEYAPHVERTHAWLVPMATALGMSEAQVDAAFREASTL